jgi:DNA-binding transcriptional LysR family regulator
MDRLAAMRVFTAVADAGSLSAAGRRLNMPLATVSRHLAALEDEIGVRLMTRTTRHLAAGTTLSPAAASSPSSRRRTLPLPGSI